MNVCSGGNVLNTGSASAHTTPNNTADAAVGSLKMTSCNVTIKSTTDSSVCCQPVTFTPDEFDDDFEPMPFCELLQLS